MFAIDDCDILSATQVVDGRTQDPGGAIHKAIGRVTTRARGTIERILDSPD